MQVLMSTKMMSSSSGTSYHYDIIITPKFAEAFYRNGGAGGEVKRVVYKYDGEVKNHVDSSEFVNDYTYNGIPLKDSYLLLSHADFVQLDHVGNYLVLYAVCSPFSMMPYLSGYIIYDAKTLEPVDKVIINDVFYYNRYVSEHKIKGDYNLYPHVILYDRWNKAFYTFINGARSQKHLTTTIITDNKLEKHVEYVDRIFVERWNPISGKVYGILFKDSKTVEVTGVLQKKFIRTRVQLPYQIDFDSTNIKGFHLLVMPDGKADILMSYSNFLQGKCSDCKVASSEKKKRALLAEFKNMQLYVEDDIDLNSQFKVSTPPKYLLYKNSKLIKTIPFLFTRNEEALYKEGKLFATVPDKAVEVKNKYLQPLEAEPVILMNKREYFSGRTYYSTSVIQGEKHFAFIEWGKSISDKVLNSIVRIFDYNGNLVYTLDTQDIVVPISQDPGSHYIVYFEQKPNSYAENNNDRIVVTMNILDVDTSEKVSVPVAPRSLLWSKVTWVPRKIPRLASKSLHNGSLNFKFYNNRLVVYNNDEVYVDDAEDMGILASRLYAIINLDTKKAFIFDSHAVNKISPSIYVQDPYMVLNDKFNAIIDEKEKEAERE